MDSFFYSSAKAILLRLSSEMVITALPQYYTMTHRTWSSLMTKYTQMEVPVPPVHPYLPDSMYFNVINRSEKVKVAIPSFTNYISYHCVAGVCCLCTGSFKAVRI